MAKLHIQLGTSGAAPGLLRPHRAHRFAGKHALADLQVDPSEPSEQGMISLAVFNDQNEPEAFEPSGVDHGSVVRRHHGGGVAGVDQWNTAMPLLDKADPTRFRDRLLIVHDDVYAGLEAIDLDPPLDPVTWLEKSRIIRHHHEFAHYATRRLFQNMRLNLHDEIIADSMGFMAAFGRFDSTLFLRAMGIEPDRVPVSEARAWTYVQGLKEPDVLEACQLTIDAARNVETWLELMPGLSPPQVLQSLARTSLPEIAGPDAIEILTATLES